MPPPPPPPLQSVNFESNHSITMTFNDSRAQNCALEYLATLKHPNNWAKRSVIRSSKASCTKWKSNRKKISFLLHSNFFQKKKMAFIFSFLFHEVEQKNCRFSAFNSINEARSSPKVPEKSKTLELGRNEMKWKCLIFLILTSLRVEICGACLSYR